MRQVPEQPPDPENPEKQRQQAEKKNAGENRQVVAAETHPEAGRCSR